jgi:integrase
MAFPANRTFRLERGLYLLEGKGARTYAARAWREGSWRYTNLGTSNYQQASLAAVKWFRQLPAAKGKATGEAMAHAAEAFLQSVRDEDKRANHAERWQAIRTFFSPGFGRDERPVSAVDSPLLMALVDWKRQQNPRVSASTIRKDLVTVRQILRHANFRGVISTMPTFPGAQQVGSIDSNPQPWLDKQEWGHLLTVANERIDDAPNKRTREQRSELRDFLLFMHATALRVDEARHLQVRDCAMKLTTPVPWESVDVRSIPDELRKEAIEATRNRSKKFVRFPYIEVRVRQSKTGPRVCQSRAFAEGVLAPLVKGKKPTDPLFAHHHRDAFRELLIAANLRTNAYGHPRNAKCLRPTAISHWLLDKPTIPLSWLAANCGTSITMLQQFYIKRLGLALDGSAWL